MPERYGARPLARAPEVTPVEECCTLHPVEGSPRYPLIAMLTSFGARTITFTISRSPM